MNERKREIRQRVNQVFSSFYREAKLQHGIGITWDRLADRSETVTINDLDLEAGYDPAGNGFLAITAREWPNQAGDFEVVYVRDRFEDGTPTYDIVFGGIYLDTGEFDRNTPLRDGIRLELEKIAGAIS